jgi:glycosyltransferase involved in cell wall biosynthesis
MEKVLVSVALCTYNGEKYLKEQLDSILLQTYSPIEIIIVDDHSNDGTVALLESYGEKNENIHLFFNEVNVGFNKNFEKAISYSRGEFIAISDQDDFWRKDKIELLKNHIADNYAIFSNSELIDSEGRPIGKKLLNNFELQNKYEEILFENFVTGHTCLMARKLAEDILPIPENGFYDWWIGFIALYNNRLTYLDECLTQHRIHGTSVIQKVISNKKSTTEKSNLSNQLSNFLSYKNLKPEDKKFIAKIKQHIDRICNPINNPLFPRLIKDFEFYFPRRKGKSFISKLNFLRKYLRIY